VGAAAGSGAGTGAVLMTTGASAIAVARVLAAVDPARTGAWPGCEAGVLEYELVSTGMRG
jgi:hypothetical protein